MSTSDGSTAANILTAALGHMRERAATYDKPEGERSMGATVDAFKAVTGVSLTEEQGWLFMALLKAVRSQQGAYRADSYEDGAAYFALAGESAVRDRNGGWTDKAIKDAALLGSFGQQNMIDPEDVEIASAIDDDSLRMQIIGQSGEMASEVYAAVDQNAWANCELESLTSESRKDAKEDENGVFWSDRGRAFNMNRWRVRRWLK